MPHKNRKTQHPYNPNPRAHLGLHALALLELSKGILALIACISLEVIGPGPIRNVLHKLILRFNLDPNHGTLPALLRAIDPQAVHIAVAIVAFYAALRFTEAWGLWRAKAWASWLGCIGTAAYLPFDIYALIRHPGWPSFVVVLINVFIVLFLARDLMHRRRR